jgi:hypothetical protein
MAIATSTALLVMAAATAVTAYGQYQQGQAQERAYNYQAAVQERNAQIAKQNADYDAQRQSSRLRRAIGSQRAAVLASGIQMEGTALELQQDTVQQGEMDRLAILYGGEINYQSARSEAELARMQGKAAGQAGTTAAFGTVLGGFGQTYAAGHKMGVFGKKPTGTT